MKLKKIFSEKISELGLDPEKNLEQLIVNGESFKNPRITKRIGEHQPVASSGRGTISLNNNEFERLANENILSSNDNKEQAELNYLLVALFHEETHAASFQDISYKKHFPELQAVRQSGYSATDVNLKWYFPIPQFERIHWAFNEAVTELVSREIFLEYTGNNTETAAPGFDAYKDSIELFEKITEKICNECKIEKDFLWKVIQRGYFAGEDLSGDKMKRLFQDIFPKDFEQKLREIDRIPEDENKNELISLIDQSIWTDDDKKRVRRWIMSVYHTMPNPKEK